MQDETLIVEVGDTQTGTVKGFDKRTGEELWSSACRDEAGHSGGLPIRKTIDDTAARLAFVMWQLGMRPGERAATLP